MTTSDPKEGFAVHTTRGALWYTGSAVAAKGIGTVSQIILAWLLKRRDFGLFGLAQTVSTFGNLLQQTGLRQILVHRQQRFDLWANPANWMSLSLGLAAAALMALFAPVAGRIYQTPQVVPLVLLLALAAPIQALTVVPAASFEISLRFGLLASLQVVRTLVSAVLTVVLASLSFGATSFVLPLPVVGAAIAVVMWQLAYRGVRVRARPQFRRWRFLVGDSATLLLANLGILVTAQADYVVLGIFHDPVVVGVYFFAYNLSLQTLVLLTSTLSSALFPTLSRLKHDSERQLRGFVRALDALALVGVPSCLLQAALAQPLIQLLFEQRWHEAVPLVQVLSLGMAIRIIAAPCISMMQAQGRFRTFLALSMANAVAFVVAVTIGAVTGAALSGAVAVAIYSVLIGPAYVYITIRPTGGVVWDVARVYLGPCAAGIVCVGSGAGLGRLLPSTLPGHEVWNILVVLVVAIAGYVLLGRRFMPGRWRDLMDRLRAVRRRTGRTTG